MFLLCKWDSDGLQGDHSSTSISFGHTHLYRGCLVSIVVTSKFSCLCTVKATGLDEC